MTDQVMQPETTETEQPQEELNPYESLLKEITDPEGRPKYSSVEDALKANKHAQTHIQTLEQENKRFKEENTRMEELFEKLSSKEQQATTEEESATTAQSESPKPEGEQQAVNKEDLFAEFEARMSQKQKEQIEKQNKETAVQRLQAAYDDKAADAIKARAKELDVTPEFLLDMAATSPKAFYTTMGLADKPKPKSEWHSSSVNSSALPNTQQKPEVKGNPLRNTKAAIDFWENHC